jgi:uncharacterized protein YkuJ
MNISGSINIVNEWLKSSSGQIDPLIELELNQKTDLKVNSLKRRAIEEEEEEEKLNLEREGVNLFEKREQNSSKAFRVVEYRENEKYIELNMNDVMIISCCLKQ